MSDQSIPPKAQAFIDEFTAARSRTTMTLTFSFPSRAQDGEARAALRGDLAIILRFLDALDLAHGTGP